MHTIFRSPAPFYEHLIKVVIAPHLTTAAQKNLLYYPLKRANHKGGPNFYGGSWPVSTRWISSAFIIIFNVFFNWVLNVGSFGPKQPFKINAMICSYFTITESFRCIHQWLKKTLQIQLYSAFLGLIFYTFLVIELGRQVL